jgi:cellulose synthase/poly-beta-1,6-N-acetylglucosamine synthase-like glycosyltransferase
LIPAAAERRIPAVLTLLLIFVAVIALWWMVYRLSPSLKQLPRFFYGSSDLPDRLNACFPGDDVREAFAGDPPQWPTVTVIVPGRNEGHILERTLGSLCSMDYPDFRVVFVDDQSTDNTAEVCRKLEGLHPHLTVIHNTQSPRDGWVGKTWAVHQAEPFMREGDYLLFTDSDLEFRPDCLRQMVRLAIHRRTDIASLLPSLCYETLGELLGLLAAMVIVNTRLSLYVSNNPKYPRTLVAGGFLLVRRDVYTALGGHAAVRGQVVEDLAFGTRAKKLGYRIFTALTHDLYTARMYEGWRDTFHGLKKNAYAGANYRFFFGMIIAAFLLLFGAMVPFYAMMGTVLWITLPSLMTFLLCVFGLLGWMAQHAVGVQTARFVGMRPRVAWLLPAGLFFYLTVFIGSMIDHYRGGNQWAGRRVANVQTLAQAARISDVAADRPVTDASPASSNPAASATASPRS